MGFLVDLSTMLPRMLMMERVVESAKSFFLLWKTCNQKAHLNEKFSLFHCFLYV